MIGNFISKLNLGLILALSLTTGALAQNPMAGNWKFNQEKSKITGDTIHFAAAADGAVRITSGGQSFSFKPDGDAATTPFGSTSQWKKIDATTWEEVVKKGSTTLSTNTYKLTDDGKSLDIAFVGTKPNGDSFNDAATYTRVSGTKGFFGVWKSTKVNLSAPTGYEIKENADGSLNWSLLDLHATVTLKTDGTDAVPTGPTVPDGLTLSLTKTGPRSFLLVEKLKGKPLFEGTETVSADGKTLTEIGSAAGVNEPTKSVYDKI